MHAFDRRPSYIRNICRTSIKDSTAVCRCDRAPKPRMPPPVRRHRTIPAFLPFEQENALAAPRPGSYEQTKEITASSLALSPYTAVTRKLSAPV